uniref:Sodium/potassium-transporting ATPase subunit beta-2-like n=1 Tax=Timema genevievae TaxID=629358 RepID=A0A7R9PIR2_TIMGE|nr:unnamed protein product [Timema genevievae]
MSLVGLHMITSGFLLIVSCRVPAGILTFYVIFFSALAALFAICMQGLFFTLDEKNPKWTLGNSLIGTNPGLGFRPLTENVETGGSLIWYRADNESQVKGWTSKLDSFLEHLLTLFRSRCPVYLNSSKLPGRGRNQKYCDYNTTLQAGQTCAVPVNNWGPCSNKAGYSYNRSSPCIFIKLNRIFDWVPEYYTDVDDLPKDMPDDLVDVIKNTSRSELNTVWVSCSGESPADRENVGNFSYYPRQGFPGYYYPYTNAEDYLSPLVAVRLQRPSMNVLINIECRAWAKNIHYVRANNERKGSVHFEVMID